MVRSSSPSVRIAGWLVIASLAGTLVEKAPARLIVEIGGVGYAVHVSLQKAWRKAWMPPRLVTTMVSWS